MPKSQTLGTDPDYSRFKVYADRREYKKLTGLEPPPFREDLPVKHWIDPAASSSKAPKLVYQNVFMTRDDGVIVLDGDKPVYEPLILTREFAASVNMLPQSEPDGAVYKNPAWRWLDPPHRDLLPGEIVLYIDQPGFLGAIPVIRNPELWAKEQAEKAAKELADSGKFTAEDREMLRSVAIKLGAM